jgi:ornithine cyclodeaminase/alanine dehydrogenase-like protein (mu-crystallin family)
MSASLAQVFDADAVRSRAPMSTCIIGMRLAMKAVSNKAVRTLPRLVTDLVGDAGRFYVMPGSMSDPPVYGAKLVSYHPTNPAHGRASVNGVMVLFDHHTGLPCAIVDGAALTALRTAAASALATDLLARKDAATLGIIGCGVQAASHLEAINAVRELREVLVWGRKVEKARRFAEDNARGTAAHVRAASDIREASACDIVCAVTASSAPVVSGEWVRPGAHVNLVGAHDENSREADSALIASARVYVDSLESAMREAGDLLIPIHEGRIHRNHIVGEIGSLLQGRIDGRLRDEEITVYKSLGVVAQDLVAAHIVRTAGHPSRDAPIQ